MNEPVQTRLSRIGSALARPRVCRRNEFSGRWMSLKAPYCYHSTPLCPRFIRVPHSTAVHSDNRSARLAAGSLCGVSVWRPDEENFTFTVSTEAPSEAQRTAFLCCAMSRDMPIGARLAPPPRYTRAALVASPSNT